MRPNDKKYPTGAVVIGGTFLGLGVVRNLASLGIPIAVVDSDYCIARFSRFCNGFYRCPPFTEHDAFAAFLVDLAAKQGLEKYVLIPTSDTAVYALAKHREVLREHYLVPTPKWEITRFAYDKRHTHALAEEIGVPMPKTHFPTDEMELAALDINFPVIVKPSITPHFFPKATVKAIRANNLDELTRYYRYAASLIERSEIMVQELIEGGPRNLYSFCSLFSRGEVRAKIIACRMRQHPMDFGSATTFAFTCYIQELEEMATRMLRRMNYYGLSEVEFMFDNKEGIFKMLEINARPWGWHSLGAKAGVNFSALLFRDMHNEHVQLDSFEVGVKWIRELTDIPIVIAEFLKRRLTFSDYTQSIKGKRELAVFSFQDPVPFIAELFSAPRMWYQRRFRI